MCSKTLCLAFGGLSCSLVASDIAMSKLYTASTFMIIGVPKEPIPNPDWSMGRFLSHYTDELVLQEISRSAEFTLSRPANGFFIGRPPRREI